MTAMNHERELDRTVAEPAQQATDAELAPGRGSRSAKLAAPAQPIYSALIQRKAARDGNGVAEGADRAVAAAATSSGSPLPATVMRKFETSLGADLSGVRVHTGAASAHAAHGVGAKAYTVGQDIHFASGQFDPQSASGQHLLAHEVAHTVQQRGGAAARQNKLEVSSPGDAFEHEADAAADAMVGGAPAKVAAAPGGVARVKDLSDAADRGGATMDTAMKDPSVTAMNVSNIADKASANQVLSTIRKASGDIQQGIATKQIDPSVLNANNEAEKRLADYTANADGQTAQISTFQGLFGALMKDFGRLDAMNKQFDGFAMGGMKDAADGEKRGAEQAKEIFGKDDAHKETARVERVNPEIKTRLDGMKIKKAGLTTKGQQVVAKSNEVAAALVKLSTNQREFLAAANAVVSPEAQQALQDAKKRAENDYSKAASDALKKGIMGAIGGLKDGPGGAAKKAAEEAGKSVWETTIKPEIDKALENADIEVGKFPDNKAEADQLAKDQAAWKDCTSKAEEVVHQRDIIRQKGDALGTELNAYEQARDLYENEMIELGQEMDKAAKVGQGPAQKPKDPCTCKDEPAPKPTPVADKGPRYETAMQFLAEADRFIAQADVVKTQGQQELAVTKNGQNTASQAHEKLVNATTAGDRPDFFYTVTKVPGKNADGQEFTRLFAQRNNFTLHNGLNPSQSIDGTPDETHKPGSAEGTDGFGANATIADSVKRVDEAKAKITAYRTKLASSIGV